MKLRSAHHTRRPVFVVHGRYARAASLDLREFVLKFCGRKVLVPVQREFELSTNMTFLHVVHKPLGVVWSGCDIKFYFPVSAVGILKQGPSNLV